MYKNKELPPPKQLNELQEATWNLKENWTETRKATRNCKGQTEASVSCPRSRLDQAEGGEVTENESCQMERTKENLKGMRRKFKSIVVPIKSDIMVSILLDGEELQVWSLENLFSKIKLPKSWERYG